MNKDIIITLAKHTRPTNINVKVLVNFAILKCHISGSCKNKLYITLKFINN